MPNDLYPPYDKLPTDVVRDLSNALSKIGIQMDSTHHRLTGYRLMHYLKTLLKKPEVGHWTAFPNENPVVSDIVVVPQIPFWAACSHHLLPFIGSVSVGYIPNKKLIGLSKIPLIVRYWAQGFWLQEHLAHAIADHLEELLQPQGVAVYIEAQHTCQLLDLGQPPIPIMKTSVLRGVLMHGGPAREEFYRLAGLK